MVNCEWRVGQDARRGQNKEASWSGSMGGFLEGGPTLERSKPAVCVGGGYSKGTDLFPSPVADSLMGPRVEEIALPRVLPIPYGAPAPFQPYPSASPLFSLPSFSPFPVPDNRGQWLRASGPQSIYHCPSPRSGSARRSSSVSWSLARVLGGGVRGKGL